MTLDEAIVHCKEEAEKLRKDSVKRLQVGLLHAASDCEECASEHEQLAEWLTELKQCRESEVNRAEILRLCNDIEDAVTRIYNSDEEIMYNDLISIRDKLQAIGKELNGDAGSKID